MTTLNRANILVFNQGSSSLKFSLYQADLNKIEVIFTGKLAQEADKKKSFAVKDAKGQRLLFKHKEPSDQRETILFIKMILVELHVEAIDIIGHRIVHSGFQLKQHCLINSDVLQRIEMASAFAPLHNPLALELVLCAQTHFSSIPHVACFDTMFHSTLPEIARLFPLPHAFKEEGIKRYGFHGLSCESIVRQLSHNLPSRLIVAHLGNGASVTAIKEGKSIDTSMGLTPTGGVMMGTRSGDLDPGLLLYLMREKKLNALELEVLLNDHSGLLGVSGVDSDMRQLHKAAEFNEAAKLAIDLFCYTLQKQIAAMISVLSGVDLIVFTGGIGENDRVIRAKICAGLACFGICLNKENNQTIKTPLSNQQMLLGNQQMLLGNQQMLLSNQASACEIQVLASDEETQIARHCFQLLTSSLPSA